MWAFMRIFSSVNVSLLVGDDVDKMLLELEKIRSAEIMSLVMKPILIYYLLISDSLPNVFNTPSYAHGYVDTSLSILEIIKYVPRISEFRFTDENEFRDFIKESYIDIAPSLEHDIKNLESLLNSNSLSKKRRISIQKELTANKRRLAILKE